MNEQSEEQAVVVASPVEIRRESDDFMPVLSIDMAVKRRESIVEFISKVLTEGIDGDYGVIPGSRKPALLKPGAEKLTSLFGLTPEFIVLQETLDWTGVDHGGEPFFYVKYRCRLSRGGRHMGESDGSCNSWESKYRWREAQRVCPQCGKPAIIKGKLEYGGGWLCFKKKDGCGAKFVDQDPAITSQDVGKVANPEIFDIVNTLHKIAQKRAHVSAVLVTIGASQFFTVDLEPGDGNQMAGAEVAETKIAAMKAGATYDSVSTSDSRKQPPDKAVSPQPARATAGGSTAPSAPPAPGGSDKRPFNLKSSIEAFAKLRALMNEKLGEETASKIYYRILSVHGALHSNELKSARPARDAYRDLAQAFDDEMRSDAAEPPDSFDTHFAGTESAR